MNNEINAGSGPADATQDTSADRLVQQEDKIRRNFEEAGFALDEIYSQQLYKKNGFQTFETYMEEQWGMRKSYAYKLIRAAQESAQCPIGHKPANVHQASSIVESDEAAESRTLESLFSCRVRFSCRAQSARKNGQSFGECSLPRGIPRDVCPPGLLRAA
jgi:hypothetical protein